MNLRALCAVALAGLLLAAPLGADEVVGPSHQSLVAEQWGGVSYVAADLKDYDYAPDTGQGLRTLTSPLGKVVVHDQGIGSYSIDFPKGKLSVEGTSSAAKVSFFGQNYEFSRVNNSKANEFVIKLPDDEVHYTVSGSEIDIVGHKGTVKIREKEGDYRVESTLGTYTYTPTPEGGFKVRGGPLARFPYLFRGARFESAGVGVFIDFKKLDPQNPLFRFIEWQPMLVFQQ